MCAAATATSLRIADVTPLCRRLCAAQPEEQTVIDLHEPVTLTFALRYLNSFTKARATRHAAMLAGAWQHDG